MVKQSNAKQAKNLSWIAIAISIVMACAIVLPMIWPAPSAIGPQGWSLAARDAYTHAAVDDDCVSGQLYGVPTAGDASDFSDYELLESFDSLEDIGEADLESEYSRFFLNVSGTNEEAPWLPFQNRWVEIYKGEENVVDLYATPSAHGVIVIDADLNPVTTLNLTESLDIAVATDHSQAVGNFSVLLALNQTEVGQAGYKSFLDRRYQEYTKVKFIVNFNSTAIEANDLELASGTVFSRATAKYNTTALAFEASTWGDNAPLCFEWDDDVEDVKITNLELVLTPNEFGLPTLLDSL